MNKRIIITALLAVLSMNASAQLFRPLGLDFYGKRQGECSQPRMHIEGDRLYVCTCQGLYAKDLTDDNSTWQLAGFEGIPLQDYARRGNDILALRYNHGGGFLLLSHDGGQTYEDVTPDFLRGEKYEVLPSLAQHPTDPNTLLVSSFYRGILRSSDFGQTWKDLTGLYGNLAASFIGFHPTRPSVIYNSGEDLIMQGHINISYDDGQTWNDHYDSLGFPGDNCVHRPTFHPTNPDHWLAGGEGVVFLSDDNGQTWSFQNYWHDVSKSAYWYFCAFDSERPDTAYMAGCTTGNMGEIKVMCSTDGGHSWYPSQTMASKMELDRVNDLQQYGDLLFIYTESDVYEVSKTDLIRQSTTAIRPVVTDVNASATYDLQGRRITQPKRGIYIKEGIKILKSNRR